MPNKKTALAAYKKVLKGINDGKVDPTLMPGSCQYSKPGENRTIHCGVGILFNQAQLDDLKRLNLNRAVISDVIDRIGEKNITTVTGLNVEELCELQNRHDDLSLRATGRRLFRNFVEKKIAALEKVI